MTYCAHILTHDIIDFVPDKNIRVKFQAVDPSFVVRTDRYKIVAGWYTWLSLDMACCLLIDRSGYQSLTEKLDVDFIKTYRYPDVVAEVSITESTPDYFYMDATLFNSGGGILATAKAQMKKFKLEKHND